MGIEAKSRAPLDAASDTLLVLPDFPEPPFAVEPGARLLPGLFSSRLTDRFSMPNLIEPELAEPIGLRLLVYECLDPELFDKLRTGEEWVDDIEVVCFSRRRRVRPLLPLERMTGEDRDSKGA